MVKMKWKVLSSEYLYRDQWFKVRKEKCETPSGKIVDPYYVYDFPTWVAAVALTEDNKVVMVKQYRHAIAEVCTELPGGCVDESDRTYEEAIARELSEETGYTFSAFEYLGKISANTSTNSNWLHMYLATGGKLSGNQNLDENEEIEVVILSIEELKKLVRDNAIPQAMHISCIHYALERIQHYNK
jgi:8-oxo-dGTP pyrophosphatase MutT (NUDIX family)